MRRKTTAFLTAGLIVATAASGQTVPRVQPPNPILYMTGQEIYTASGRTFMRYRYDVLNTDAYPADMFAPAPTLPPCGNNANASRTWVEIFKADGTRLNGFCALSRPADLHSIWFALEEGVVPPSYIYVELRDRQANRTYRSNLADTVL